jgi:hypothetical protein
MAEQTEELLLDVGVADASKLRKALSHIAPTNSSKL